MAPEQALGLVDQIDARTDQFALAEVAYTMLTGRVPFSGGDSASLLHQVVHEQPPQLFTLLRWDTREIQAVLDRALAKRPEDRFDSIVEFAWGFRAAAHSALHGRTPAAPIAARGPQPPPVRRSRAMSPPPIRPLEPLAEAEPPRRLDRVPRGPQLTLVLGLVVLGLAATIVHDNAYRGFAGRAAHLGQVLASMVFVRDGTRPVGVPPSVPAVVPMVQEPAPSRDLAPAPSPSD
jgi:hypothetical protein